jgi:hypothetical protein
VGAVLDDGEPSINEVGKGHQSGGVVLPKSGSGRKLSLKPFLPEQ